MAVVADPRIPQGELMVRCMHGLVTRFCTYCWLKLQKRYGIMPGRDMTRPIKRREFDDEVLAPDEEPPGYYREKLDDDDEHRFRDPAELGLEIPPRKRRSKEPDKEWDAPSPPVSVVAIAVAPLIQKHQEVCSVCKNPKRVRSNRKTGKPICDNCFRVARYRDPSTHEQCSRCGNVRPVATRNESGKSICHNCYNRHRLQQRAKMAAHPA